MKRRPVRVVVTIVIAVVLVAALVIRARFEADLAVAVARAAQGGVVVATRCGPIKVQQAGDAAPLLLIHGSGGGHIRAWPGRDRRCSRACA